MIVLMLVVVVAAAAVGVLAYRYYGLKVQMFSRVQQEVEAWRERDLERVREEARRIAGEEARLQYKQWQSDYSQSIRQDAIQKSQAVTLGKVTEHFVPYLPEFGYNPKDARFLGSPVDFVVFDGLDEGEVRSIVFVEVKTGSSALSPRERCIRDAIRQDRVQWVELRPQL
jgi:predicted Holliday junction resolvase-like endonuclease